jgi:membrane-associated phospholipid phosphatase
MPPARIDDASGYLARVALMVWLSIARLMRPPSHSRRAEAARRLSRRWLVSTLVVAVVVVALMFMLDAPAIRLMPHRGTADLWPIRIITDFGKAAYVLLALAAVLAIVVLALPRVHGQMRAILIGFGTRVQFIFLAVAFSILISEVIKVVVGRGRPFVGGKANPFNFVHFDWAAAYASFPSGHATTSFALAFAVSSVWPRTRVVMFAYAVVIVLSRLVLLAHHPSDVVAGALVGAVGAMFVRHWFAVRRLGFTIRRNGEVVALNGPSAGDLKRVARAVFAPYEAGSANRV